jgi:hypothetical protein
MQTLFVKLEKRIVKDSQIITLLASTQSDNFTEAGKAQGEKNHEVVQALVDCTDRYTMLKALQVAFALGIKAAHRSMEDTKDRATYTINEAIKDVKYKEQHP